MTSRAATVALFAVVVSACGTAVEPDDAAMEPSVCVHASDCAGGLVCIAGSCVTPTPCTSSRTCPGLVCDTATSTCVECRSDADCMVGTWCAARVCEPLVACTSDRQCSARAEVCNSRTMFCVECNADVDCGAGLVCRGDHVCVPPWDAGAASVDGGGVLDAGMDAQAPGVDAAVDAVSAPVDTAIDAWAPDTATIDTGLVRTLGAWESVPAGGGVHYPGFSDGAPLLFTFFALTGGAASGTFAQLDTTTGAWTPLTPLALGPEGYFASPARLGGGNTLVLINGTSVYIRDAPMGSASWRTLATGVAQTTRAQNTHESTGRVFTVADDGRIVEWDGSSVAYHSVGLSVPISTARVAYSQATHRLYVAPDIGGTRFYEVTLDTWAIRALAPIPEPRFTPTFCNDADTYPYLYAAGGNTGTTIWRYDVVADAWSPLPALPFDHDANGACTVTYDGWLYVTDDGTRLARIRLR